MKMLNQRFSQPNVVWVFRAITERRFCKCISHPSHQIDLYCAWQSLVYGIYQSMVRNYPEKSNDGIFIDPLTQPSVSPDELCGYRLLQLNRCCIAPLQI